MRQRRSGRGGRGGGGGGGGAWLASALAALVAVGVAMVTTAPHAATASTCPTLGTNPTNAALTTAFFSAACYNLASAGDASGAGACVASALGLSSCAGCFATAEACVVSSCADTCSRGTTKTTACLQCASNTCAGALKACAGSSATVEFVVPCSAPFCNAPAWQLPVVIAGSIVGGTLLIVFGVWAVRRFCREERYDSESSGCCSCSCNGCASLCADRSKLGGAASPNGSMRSMGGRTPNQAPRTMGSGAKRGNNNNNNDDELFDMEMPEAVRSGSTSSANPQYQLQQQRPKQPDADPFEGGKRAETVVEHNVRASRLPENFRKSIQPGALTPEMIFGNDTAESMKKANAAAVPQAVIASHKALKMMGVSEGEVQKPYSETVTERVERLAKAANKVGYGVGGATAALGSEMVAKAEQKRKQAEERAEARRRAELEKEEARIRAEISREARAERAQRDSQRMNSEDAKRFSESMQQLRKSRAESKKKDQMARMMQGGGGEGGGGAGGGNRLAQFLAQAEGNKPQ